MSITEIKQNLATNISTLRMTAGFTQAQLAEKLHYSDKAISKWERAESVPDIAVMKQIADMFGVTVDWLISDNGGRPTVTDEEIRKTVSRNRLLITLLSGVAVFFVATAVYVALSALATPRSWLPFIWAVPACAVDLLVFNAVWGSYKMNFLFISLIIWSIPAALYITLAQPSLWFIFIFAIPLQVATIFWSQIKIIITPKPKTIKKPD